MEVWPVLIGDMMNNEDFLDLINTLVGDIAKEVYREVIIKAVIKKAITAIPLLSLPLINPFVVYIITRIANSIYTEAEMSGMIFLIRFKKNEDRIEYDKATLELRKLIFGNGSEEEIQKAQNDFKKRLSSLVRITPILM